ncbi:MAG: D-alanyl-D-alanine carboxypeptidase/D-alanyl-D-alanine-endopeptidase [Acidobacteriaceae bacterium]
MLKKTHCLLVAVLGALAAGASAQDLNTFTGRVQTIMNRPEYKHSSFGIEIYSLDSQQPLFRLNADKLFTPGSTTKLLTEGTALQLLGADYRFHTLIYRTGEIDRDGVLKGDIVLVASGDPNLSNRIQPDNTLAFEDEDHAYGGSEKTKAVPGDPLKVIREFADQIAAKGIKKVDGKVLVDSSLFPDEGKELGTGTEISSIAVNDNVVDVTIGAGAAEGAPATMTVSPQTAYMKFVNKIITSPAGGRQKLEGPVVVANPDGTSTVTLSGTAPLHSKVILYGYPVPEPVRFAETVLAEVLAERGISANLPRPDEKIEFGKYSQKYIPENVVAEHISPPFSEEIKVTLKVSQNLHASMIPYLLGSILGKARTNIDQAGFDLERGFLQKAGLDLSGASQADGAGGAASAFFTPDFMVHYLGYMAKQADYPLFHRALPVLGRDGTLVDTQKNTPAAGKVFAKTGTYDAYDMLNKRIMLTGKGLAGYTTTQTGQHLAFALYVNRVGLPADDPDAAQNTAGEALGEIAAAAYELPIDKPVLDAHHP